MNHNQYLFLHIPKTAGTTFRAMLQENFEESEIFPTNAEIKQKGKPYSNAKSITTLKAETKQNIKLFNGHFQYDVVKHLDNPYTILFLRCPIKRTISNILHFKSYIPRFKSKSIREILDTLPLIQTSNAYVRYLSSSSEKMNKNNPVTNKELKVAYQNLCKVDFVGLLDCFEEDVVKLRKETGLNLELSIKKNVNKKNYKIPFPIYREIINKNQLDLALYHKYIYNVRG